LEEISGWAPFPEQPAMLLWGFVREGLDGLLSELCALLESGKTPLSSDLRGGHFFGGQNHGYCDFESHFIAAQIDQSTEFWWQKQSLSF
jgi:hypothetical protein